MATSFVGAPSAREDAAAEGEADHQSGGHPVDANRSASTSSPSNGAEGTQGAHFDTRGRSEVISAVLEDDGLGPMDEILKDEADQGMAFTDARSESEYTMFSVESSLWLNEASNATRIMSCIDSLVSEAVLGVPSFSAFKFSRHQEAELAFRCQQLAYEKQMQIFEQEQKQAQALTCLPELVIAVPKMPPTPPRMPSESKAFLFGQCVESRMAHLAQHIVQPLLTKEPLESLLAELSKSPNLSLEHVKKGQDRLAQIVRCCYSEGVLLQLMPPNSKSAELVAAHLESEIHPLFRKANRKHRVNLKKSMWQSTSAEGIHAVADLLRRMVAEAIEEAVSQVGVVDVAIFCWSEGLPLAQASAEDEILQSISRLLGKTIVTSASFEDANQTAEHFGEYVQRRMTILAQHVLQPLLNTELLESPHLELMGQDRLAQVVRCAYSEGVLLQLLQSKSWAAKWRCFSEVAKFVASELGYEVCRHFKDAIEEQQFRSRRVNPSLMPQSSNSEGSLAIAELPRRMVVDAIKEAVCQVDVVDVVICSWSDLARRQSAASQSQLTQLPVPAEQLWEKNSRKGNAPGSVYGKPQLRHGRVTTGPETWWEATRSDGT
ncbi:unnamed protein product [Polarella glacialis]|uniref:Uncharacterized protein n=1 Tax=Polarella glacialis TaxID=89957 RepID=A0A813LYP1_POLGL|nr:unnamed protein product [Polarella glacialis]